MKGFSTYAEYRDSLVNRGISKHYSKKRPVHMFKDVFYNELGYGVVESINLL